jgi:hypothetical protein
MSFNSLSISKLGIGFGALAVAGIGLLGNVPIEQKLPSKTEISVSGVNIPLVMNTKVKEDKVTNNISILLREDEEIILLVQALISNRLI